MGRIDRYCDHCHKPAHNRDVTIACNGAGGRVGFEINAYRAGPLMRDVHQSCGATSTGVILQS